MAEVNKETVKPRSRPRKNLVSMIEEFKMGNNNVNDLAYEGRIVTIKNYDVLEKPSGPFSRKSIRST